jgi:hypothetical protein
MITTQMLSIIVGLVSIGYWGLTLLFESAPLNDELDGILMAYCTVVVYQYATWTLARPKLIVDRAIMIRYGIVLAWGATAVWRLERFLMQIHTFGYHGPIGAHDPLRGYMIALLSAGAAYHILAYRMVNPGKLDWKALLLLTTLAIAGMLIIFGLKALTGQYD